MRTKIALVCTVWGSEFTDFFCQYSLATLLSPAGLPHATQRHDFTLLLYTLEQNLERMRAHGNFQKLATLVDIRTILLESMPPAARQGHWFQWHHALLRADEFSSFILLIPDCLFVNDAIGRIVDALQENDIVYYCVPQVSLEPLQPELSAALKRAKSDAAFTYLDYSETDIASLFVKYINPRYAVALHKPEYFVTHPEFALRPSREKIELHELSCHAMAVSSRATSVAYTLNSPARGGKSAFLGLLAVGVEYTFKYFEQYFRWPVHEMRLSRFSTLASWSHNYFEPGATDYTATQTEITLAGLKAVAQRRTLVTNPRLRYARAALEYYAAIYSVYEGPAHSCRREVRRAIAIAMCLPGFRKALMSDSRPLTILLPTSKGASRILQHLFARGKAQYVLQFILMHVIPGRLMLKAEHPFIFEKAADRPSYHPRLRVIDSALTHVLTDAVIGHITSLATHITDDVIAYAAEIQYGPVDEFVERLVKNYWDLDNASLSPRGFQDKAGADNANPQ
jgi:hypothetical protein